MEESDQRLRGAIASEGRGRVWKRSLQVEGSGRRWRGGIKGGGERSLAPRPESGP